MTFANLEFYLQHTTQLGTKPKGENMEKDISQLVESFPTGYGTQSAHTKIGSIPDFLWSGVKLPV